MSGIVDWLEDATDSERAPQVVAALMGLATLFGRGKQAARIISVLASVPGRVEALRDAQAKIDELAGGIEDRMEADPTAHGPDEAAGLELTVAELLALDDWMDLQSQTSRQLKRLLRRRRSG